MAVAFTFLGSVAAMWAVVCRLRGPDGAAGQPEGDVPAHRHGGARLGHDCRDRALRRGLQQHTPAGAEGEGQQSG